MVARSFLKTMQQALRRAPLVHKAIRSVWTPPPSVFAHLYFNGIFTVEVAPGAEFRIQSNGEQVENDLFWRGYGKGWERHSLKVWSELARSADTILDIGANTGVFALAAKAVNRSARVIAVEPVKRVAAKLRRNNDLNGFDIEVVECAASDFNGNATLYDFPGEHEYSASLESTMEGSVQVTVEVRRLDDFVDRVDLVKIDVERHEAATLRGMRPLLERCLPVMLIEVLDAEAEETIRAELAGLDYSWRMIEGERNALLTPANARD
jgi:FkbM family methyltransferase